MKKIISVILLILFTAQLALAANKVVFVDKRCATNGDGTSEVCTVGGAGTPGPYNTCANGIAGEVSANADLTTLAGRITFDFRGGATADSVQCVVAGFTNTTRDFLIRFQTSGANRPVGPWDATKYRLATTTNGSGALDVRIPNFEIDGMQIESLGTGSGTYIGLNAGTGSLEILATNNNFRSAACAGPGGGGGSCSPVSWRPNLANTRNYFINNVGTASQTSTASTAVFSILGSANNNGEITVLYGNTAIGGQYGFSTHGGGSSDAIYLKDNIANLQWTTGYNLNTGSTFATSVTSSNISGDNSSPDNTTTCGGGTCRSKLCSFVSTTFGSENARLVSGDTNCKDAGVSLAIVGVLPFQNDRDGNPRYDAAWDIGAHEYIAPTGGGGGGIGLGIGSMSGGFQ